MMMELGFEVFALLFMAAFVAAFIDAIAGGGGLITIPALLMTGMPPAMALGTNKLQAFGGVLSASAYFLRKKAVDLKSFWFILLMIFIGGLLGALVIQRLDPGFIKMLLPFLILAIGLYFLFTPKLGADDRKNRISYAAFALILGTGLGFYDGFFGPGTGSLMNLACVLFLGFNLTKSTAHTKVMNLSSNFAALLMFLGGGHIVWSVGLVMMAGAMLGANFGAKMVMSRGRQLIRPMVVVMSFIMTLKLCYDQGWFNF